MIEASVGQHGTRTPWSLILYNDGISPTDSASHHDQRKMVGFYWSIREFGQKALVTEEAWHVFATVRQKTLDSYSGGISRFTRDLVVEKYFKDFMTSGLFLDVAGAVAPLTLCLWCFVADVPALKDFFNNMGHGGLKPCPLCRNVLLRRLYNAALHHGFVTTATPDFSQFVLHTRESINQLCRHLETQKVLLPQGEFDELETCSGFSYHPQMLPLNPLVDISSQLMYDWPHEYIVGGILDSEFGKCMAVLRRTADNVTTYTALGDIVKKFTWPASQRQGQSNKLFKKAAIKSHLAAGAFNSTASQLLSLVPVFAFYFANLVASDAIAHGTVAELVVLSLLACFDVVELLNLTRLGVVSPDVLQTAITNHFKLYIAAYGEDTSLPKHHFAMHLADMLRRFGMLLSCLVMERLHRLLKRFTLNRRNLTSYEIGCIEDVTVNQMRDRKVEWMLDGLVNRTKPTRGKIKAMLAGLYPKEEVFVSRVVRVARGIVTMSDVVLYRVNDTYQCGRVRLNFSRGGVAYSLISVWERAPRPGGNVGHALRFKTNDAVDTSCVHPCTCIEEAVIFFRSTMKASRLCWSRPYTALDFV